MIQLPLPVLADVQLTEQQQRIRDLSTELLTLLLEAVPSNVMHYAVEEAKRPLLILRAQAPKVHTADFHG